MTTITPSDRHHLTTDAAYRDVEAVLNQSSDLPVVREVTDRSAVTIASWWQSAGWDGRAFATLASGLPVTLDALLNDIATARRHTHESRDLRALDCLATWAINHPSRKETP